MIEHILIALLYLATVALIALLGVGVFGYLIIRYDVDD